MTVADHVRFRQPAVKRLGLEDGWWFFCSHFLNLGLPSVFIDACLLPNDVLLGLGLEHFGTRTPATPIPAVALQIEILGDGVKLFSGEPPSLVASHWFRSLTLIEAVHAPNVGVLVGDSYALQLTWSALWTSRVGTATNEGRELKVGT